MAEKHQISGTAICLFLGANYLMCVYLVSQPSTGFFKGNTFSDTCQLGHWDLGA